MKTLKYTTKIVSIIFLTSLFSCKAQSQASQITTYNTEIIGTWVSETDANYKIEFTTSNVQKEYIDNVVQAETNFFAIESSCGTHTNNGFDIYLKRSSSYTDFVCDVINNINTDQNGETTLSITTERGKLEVYVKQ